MGFVSAKEIAEKWGISSRRVITLCSDNRIGGAMFIGNMWIIPDDAVKPFDARKIINSNNTDIAKPFLKWAGGKGQLIHEISKYYPFGVDEAITKYAEPFVGGGAVLFDILNNYNLEEVYISDINTELITTYQVIRDNVEELINSLKNYEAQFNQNGTDGRKTEYYALRSLFNELKKKKDDNIAIAALMIFLNKTCFNGLYRVNKNGDFNVPLGSYKNPQICNENNLRAVSRRLKNVKIVCGDYKESCNFIDDKTFVYFDPPYRPLTPTANFTSYTKELFDDKNQLELANFVQLLDNKGAKVVVSNSDPKNTNENDNFFDDAYSSQKIRRVLATRMINRNSDKRGKINELLISNF